MVSKNLQNASIVRFATRVKGGGGLGRPRYVAIARWRGGRIVREAKALVPSAWNWAHNKASSRLRFLDLAKGAFRSPDPFLALQSGFLFRRIAADSRKVELGDNAGAKLKLDLLRAMGFDLGAIHSAEAPRKRSAPISHPDLPIGSTARRKLQQPKLRRISINGPDSAQP
jgi:hypothetical protein